MTIKIRVRLVAKVIFGSLVLAWGLHLFSPPAQAEEPTTSEAQLFGLAGRGSSFVYVIDRSLSMKGEPLTAAKRELLASIHRLTRVQQFQIVFYNERARTMQPARMTFADDDGLHLAEAHVKGMSASGATDHVQALVLALRMKPDVVFFLTDADEPQLTAKELDTIWRKNEGSIINTIEFKSGPDPGTGVTLRKLAEQNRGEYKYVDVTALKTTP